MFFSPEDPLYKTATSLTAVTSTPHDIRALYKTILTDLNHWYSQWRNEAFLAIYKAWKNEQAYLGKPLEIHQKDGELVSGVAQQILPNGDLVLINDAKKQKIISFYQVEEVKVTISCPGYTCQTRPCRPLAWVKVSAKKTAPSGASSMFDFAQAMESSVTRVLYIFEPIGMM